MDSKRVSDSECSVDQDDNYSSTTGGILSAWKRLWSVEDYVKQLGQTRLMRVMLYQPGSSSTAILAVLFGSSSTLTEIAGHETEKKKKQKTKEE